MKDVVFTVDEVRPLTRWRSSMGSRFLGFLWGSWEHDQTIIKRCVWAHGRRHLAMELIGSFHGLRAVRCLLMWDTWTAHITKRTTCAFIPSRESSLGLSNLVRWRGR